MRNFDRSDGCNFSPTRYFQAQLLLTLDYLYLCIILYIICIIHTSPGNCSLYTQRVSVCTSRTRTDAAVSLTSILASWFCRASPNRQKIATIDVIKLNKTKECKMIYLRRTSSLLLENLIREASILITPDNQEVKCLPNTLSESIFTCTVSQRWWVGYDQLYSSKIIPKEIYFIRSQTFPLKTTPVTSHSNKRIEENILQDRRRFLSSK